MFRSFLWTSRPSSISNSSFSNASDIRQQTLMIFENAVSSIFFSAILFPLFQDVWPFARPPRANKLRLLIPLSARRVPLIAFRKSWDILHGTVVAQDHFQMITTGMASRSFHQQYENPRALLKKTGIGEFYMKMPLPLPSKRRDKATLFPPPLRGKRPDAALLFPPPLRGRARVGVIFILHCAPSRAWVLLIMFRIDQTNLDLLQDVPGDGTYLPRPGRSFPRLPFWKGHKFFYNTLIWER